MIERVIKKIGCLLILVAVIMNPKIAALLLSPDHKIDSSGIVTLIIVAEIILGVIGFLFFVAPGLSLRMMKRKKREAILICCLYLGLEFLVMALGVFVPQPSEERIRYFRDFLGPNERLGYTMRPNLSNFEVTWLDEEVRGVYDSDADGFRNAGIDSASSSVFFIGDSFTFGAWVTRDESYVGRFGRQYDIPVIDYGIGGYGMTQYEVLSRDVMPKTDQQKTVFLGFFANDLEAPVPESAMPTFYETELLPQTRMLGFWDRFSFQYSVTGKFLQLLFHPRGQAVMENGMSLFTDRGASISFMLRDHIAFQASLERLFTTLKHRGDVAAVYVILIPSKESVYREEYEALFGDATYLLNEDTGFRMIKNTADRYDIRTLDMTPVFRDHKGEKLYFDIDAHLNPQGHALLADSLIDWLTYVEQQ